MADLAKLVDELSALTVMEAADLPLKKKTNSTSFWQKPVLTKSMLLKKFALLPVWV